MNRIESIEEEKTLLTSFERFDDRHNRDHPHITLDQSLSQSSSQSSLLSSHEPLVVASNTSSPRCSNQIFSLICRFLALLGSLPYRLYLYLSSFKKRWWIGVCLLLMVNFIWVSSSILIQNIFANLSFQKPFFLTYFSTSLFSIYLFGFVILKSWRQVDFEAEQERKMQQMFKKRNIQQESSSLIASQQESSLKLPISQLASISTVLESESSDVIPVASQSSTTLSISQSPQSSQSVQSSQSLDDHERENKPYDSLFDSSDHVEADVSLDDVLIDQSSDDPSPPPNTDFAPLFSVRQVALLALQFCPIWFLANVSYNWSLSRTSVSSNTIISTTSSFFTLLICHLFKVERFTWIRSLALILTIGGVVMVALSDKASSNHNISMTRSTSYMTLSTLSSSYSSTSSSSSYSSTSSSSSYSSFPSSSSPISISSNNNSNSGSIVGDLVALLAAIFYGAYTSFLRIRIQDDRQIRMAMFFGFVGFFNMILLWPLFFLFHFTKIETFEIPPLKVTGMLLLNGLIGTVISDLLWSLVIFLTSATVATVGLSLNVPMAMVADIILKSKRFPPMYYAGASIVLIGFLVANVAK